MAEVETRENASQGRANYLVTIDAGEVVTFSLGSAPYPIDWSQGGMSWVVHPGSGGEMTVEYSLLQDDDYWSPASDSPYDEKTQGHEISRFERIRFSAATAEGNVEILSVVPLEWEVT